MTETQFKAKVQRLLTEHGVWHVKFMGNRFTKAGVPDILACIGGWFWGIELKTNTGRTSPIQDYQLEQIRKAGGRTIVLRPSDLAAFRKELITWTNSATAASSSGINADSPGT